MTTRRSTPACVPGGTPSGHPHQDASRHSDEPDPPRPATRDARPPPPGPSHRHPTPEAGYAPEPRPEGPPRTARRSGAADGSFHYPQRRRQHRDHHAVAEVDLVHAGTVKHTRRPGIGVAPILEGSQVRFGELLVRATAQRLPQLPADETPRNLGMLTEPPSRRDHHCRFPARPVAVVAHQNQIAHRFGRPRPARLAATAHDAGHRNHCCLLAIVRRLALAASDKLRRRLRQPRSKPRLAHPLGSRGTPDVTTRDAKPFTGPPEADRRPHRAKLPPACDSAFGPASRCAQRRAFSARLRADRRPYRRAQKLVSTSVISRTRSS